MELTRPKRSVDFTVSGGGLPEGVSVRVHGEIDFTGISEDELISWAMSNRIIAVQRNLRNMSQKGLEAIDTYKVHARECGRKVQSPEEIKQSALSAFDKMSPEQQQEYLKELQMKAAGHKVEKK